MKKFVLSVIFFLMLIPYMVYAEDFKYQITAKVELENREIKENEFTFELIDSDDNVVDTKKNNQEGIINFDPIPFLSSEVNITGGTGNSFAKDENYGYRFYTIRQVDKSNNVYQYDEEESYVGVYFFADGTSEIHYLKDIDKTIEEWTYKPKRDATKIYHATEEELQGQAYAVLDNNTGILTFFRDEVGKYNDYQSIGDKIYYTNIEGDTYHAPWGRDNRIQKIVFENSIKPKVIYNNLESWFNSLSNLEEIENINLLDTSLITTFEDLFAYDYKLTKLDLTTWDTSNVNNLKEMFYHCDNLEEAYIDNFDTSRVLDFGYMFRYTKVKTVNPSTIDVSSATNIQGMFYNVQGIEALDFSSWSNDNMPSAGMLVSDCPDVKFTDVSTIKKIGSNGVGLNRRLSIINLSGDYDYLTSGIGNYSYYWYNLNNRTLYDNDELRQHIDFNQEKDLEPATYVRPDSNPIPSVFYNKYIEPNKKNNPETSNKILLFAFIITTCLGIGTLIYKRKESKEK